ncbi:MAG: PEP-CTERM-box response regulator transcription factor [Opitutaceae bacterium]
MARLSLDAAPPLNAVVKGPLVLVVADDDGIRGQLKWALAPQAAVIQASNRASALVEIQARRPAVVVLDLGQPNQNEPSEEGMAMLSAILDIDPSIKVIVASDQNERATALRAVGAGAYDVLGKPVDGNELTVRIRRCLHVVSLEREYRELKKNVRVDGLAGMIGNCPAVQKVCASLRKVATTEAPVLILGESGTGKEMAARAIHDQSARRQGPYVAINCSAIPETLLESELFGHEKGAFTGANVQRKGRIEQASGGTLFLDEIGDVPASVQVKLLRFLQEKTIERVGGRVTIPADVRVIAATHKDLVKAREQGTFREDFYYRLSVVQIVLPPLRERGADIHLLAQSFLHRFSAENKRTGLTYSVEALRAIQRYHWPGNIRELQNKVRRAVIMGESQRLSARDLELSDAPVGNLLTLKEAREDLEREMIRRALAKNEGRVVAAAAELGVSRPSLYDLMGKLGLDRTET